jgi:hypothetical protein
MCTTETAKVHRHYIGQLIMDTQFVIVVFDNSINVRLHRRFAHF